MPANNKKANTTTETPVAPAPTPVVAKKGGKAPVAAAPVTPVPVAKKGGKASVAATPVPVVTPPAPVAAKKGGKAAAAAAPVVATPVATTPVKKTPVKKTATGGAKKAVVPKKTAAPVVTEDGEEADGERPIRSFKVRLPGSENFEGRFTGLTPYQAANKALSKYFRETEKPAVEITFSICESTRKSRKSTYTYVGGRQELAEPVRYKIADGREIVKKFKNTLKKVKKSAETA